MDRKLILAAIVVVVILATSGFYFGVHKSKSASPSYTRSTVVAKKTTYLATVSNSVFTTKSSSTLGQYLTVPIGKALYTYSKDRDEVSNCTASCIASWPPYVDALTSGTSLPANVSTITRTDNGTVQYTYKGLPLYTYVHDSGTKVMGNNVSGFKLVRL
jgi:predicted lipoprotein with Yx(FWY)xxD motif